MALGTITVPAHLDSPGGPTPVFADVISFAGDGAYPTGGTAAFQAAYRAKVSGNREILAVISQDCGGYVAVYDKTNDKLKVYEEGADGGPADEVGAAANLSGVTFNVIVLSK